MELIRITIKPQLTETAMSNFEGTEELVLRVEIHRNTKVGQMEPIGSCTVRVCGGKIEYNEFSSPFPQFYKEHEETPISKALHEAVHNYASGFFHRNAYTWIDPSLKSSL